MHFLNSFPLETNFFFQFSNNDWIEQTREIKHPQIRNRSSLSIHWHPMRFLVTVPNLCPLFQRFQIRDCRLSVPSFCLQLFLSVRRMGVSPCQFLSILKIYRNSLSFRWHPKKNLKWKFCKTVGCYSTLADANMGPVNVKSQPSFWGRGLVNSNFGQVVPSTDDRRTDE